MFWLKFCSSGHYNLKTEITQLFLPSNSDMSQSLSMSFLPHPDEPLQKTMSEKWIQHSWNWFYLEIDCCLLSPPNQPVGVTAAKNKACLVCCGHILAFVVTQISEIHRNVWSQFATEYLQINLISYMLGSTKVWHDRSWLNPCFC